MPRKFLGQRIELANDFVRPASLSLTDVDLRSIPDVPDFSDLKSDKNDDYLLNTSNEGGRRISRQFGGTQKLKKRLSSVPELLLRDLDQLQKNAGIKLCRRRPPLPLPDTCSTLPVLLEEKGDASKKTFPADPSNSLRKALDKPQNACSSPLAKPPIVSYSRNLIVYPVSEQQHSPEITELLKKWQSPPASKEFEHSKNHSHKKSDGEIIYEQIIRAYMSLPENERPPSSVINSELSRSLSRHFEPNGSLSAFKHVQNRSSGFFDSLMQNQDQFLNVKNSKLPTTPQAQKELEESLSTAEYSNPSSSDPCSSGGEFSDVGSIVSSCVMNSQSMNNEVEEVYYSADDTLPDFQSSESSNDCLSMRYLHSIQISPQVLHMDDVSSYMDDEIDDILEIQSEIDDLVIADNTSSIYED